MLFVFFHLLLDGSFQLVGVSKQILDAAELGYQFLCRFFSHTRASRNVVGRISHESEHVDDLQRRLDVELGLDFFHSHHFKIFVTVFGAIHEHVFTHQLSVVLVGSHHVGIDASFTGFRSQCTDYVVGFVSGNLQNRNMIGTYDILYDRNRLPDSFRSLFPLRFVCFISFVAKRRPRRVEGNSDVSGIFFP